MDIRQEINHLKTVLGQGTELLLLRLRLLRLDVEEQLTGAMKIFACIAFAAVFTLIFVVALLLGLNVLLPENVKLWVFFGVAAVAFVVVCIMILCIPVIWQTNRMQLSHTLNEMQNDLARLRGTSSERFSSSRKTGEET